MNTELRIVIGSDHKGVDLKEAAIELLKAWGFEVEERKISVDELFAAAADGSLEEAWGTGTAAVVSPIGQLFYQGNSYTLCGGEIGPVAQKLYDQLTGIQWGKVEDKFGWTQFVCNG